VSTQHTARGLPYPEPSDPVQATPAALQALAAAITSASPLGLSWISNPVTLSGSNPGSQALLTFPGLATITGSQITTRVRGAGADALLWRTGGPPAGLVPGPGQVLATARVPANANNVMNGQTGVCAIGWGTLDPAAAAPLPYPSPAVLARDWPAWIKSLADATGRRLPQGLAAVSGSFTTNANGDAVVPVPALAAVRGAVVNESTPGSATASVFAVHDMTGTGTTGLQWVRVFDGRVNPATVRANYTVKLTVMAWGTPA
jgi:hypothetical protein